MPPLGGPRPPNRPRPSQPRIARYMGDSLLAQVEKGHVELRGGFTLRPSRALCRKLLVDLPNRNEDLFVNRRV
jgi:hypothetical protein